MSGGVDSSVAAFLLKQATPNNFSKLFGRPTPKGFRGYNVTGVFMKCYNIDGCAVADMEDARRVANHLNIPFYVFDFEEEYKKQVVQYMIDGYRKGLTPNPDVMCNKKIKFDLFLKESLKMDADLIATGHYVRLRRKSQLPITNYQLLASKDANKDQSYFLWTLAQNQLKHCLFPIGEYLKPKVREIARQAGLPTAEKKDSQGICFLGKFSLAGFLKKHIPPKKGDILNTDGQKIGEHDGIWFYTIGQRHIGAKISSGVDNQKPRYVTAKNLETNTITVSENDPNPKKEIELSDVNFISTGTHILHTTYCLPVSVRTRYRQPLMPATLNWSLVIGRWSLTFASPQKFIAPGQSAAFYSKKGELLGGGVITATSHTNH